MLNVKAVVGGFNQEKALVGAFSVIVKTDCETDGALHSTREDAPSFSCPANEGWMMVMTICADVTNDVTLS